MSLVHNSPVTRKTDYKEKKSPIQISHLRDLKRNPERTEKPERIYFLWFLFLKLLLEMEEKNLCFKVGKSRKEFLVGKDVKIDKDFYRDWDLDEVLTYPFWKWWRSHKNLFEKPSIVVSNSTKGWKSESHFRFMRIDTRTDYRTIQRDVQRELNDLKGKKSDIFKYKVFGEPQYDNEILRYNVMVRILNEEEDVDILQGEKKRMEKIEKTWKGGVGFDESNVNVNESELWTLERQWKKLSPEQKETQFTKKYEEDRDKELGEGKVSLRIWKPKEHQLNRDFRSRLRMELSRYTKESQLILNGVSQGKYRKPTKF